MTLVLAGPAVADAAAACPCSVWSSSTVPANPAETSDGNAVELGVKFRPSVNGTVTALRFYKASTNTGTHVGRLWSASGTQLAAVTFSGETGSGWQQANLPAPVAVTANTTYVASYHAPNGNYAADPNYFSSGVTNGPLRALSSSESGGNGVYSYGASAFPSNTYSATNYWVDVVFSDSGATPDTTPPTVAAVSPSDGATAVNAAVEPTATFSEAMNAATITTSTVQLSGPGGLVPAGVNYDSAASRAILTPTGGLADSTTYTMTVKGGASGVADAAGNRLASDRTWSFTTAAPPPPPDSGPGGPILVITKSSSRFGQYYAEILRAEGLNAFALKDISTVSASTLAAYDVAILADMTLTAAQVTMLGDWVTGGGNLVAMRPDPQLATLLGLSGAGTTLANAYLKIDTSKPPGTGIVADSIQFHGTADRWTLNGATSVATLYSSASAATTNPAVTLRSVGGNGGQAASFTFDLARSIIQTRQGNPAWAGQERDGTAPIRSDDMFFGAAQGNVQPDWVDLSKVAIPQADEQQRLLANLIGLVNADRKPLPRFWYLPRDEKAAVVMTGDDHGNGGTSGQFDNFSAASPAGCDIAAWECIRATSYIYTNTPLTNTTASQYSAGGFEIGLHVNTNCSNYTAATLEGFVSNQLTQFQAKYTSLPPVVTNRTHCIVWSDWASHPKVELAHGIRLDTNYYYWPGSWINNRPGFFTGSGMPMRFTDVDGSMIDVYQATTQMTDESGQSYPFTSDALLNGATGASGFYGVFTANMHTDSSSHPSADAIVASAKARSVPVVSAKQMLTWLDGRNASSFGSIAWTGGALSFTVNAGSSAGGLRGMVPASVNGSAIGTMTRNGSSIPITRQVIKGVEYAFFDATDGSYTATYAADTTPPTVTAITPADGATGVAQSVAPTATFSEPMDVSTITASTVQLSGPSGSVSAAVSYDATARRVTLTPSAALASSATYTVTVKGGAGGVADTAGNRLAADRTWSFTTVVPDTTPPVISAVTATATVSGTATVAWTTNEASSTRVDYGSAPASLSQNVSNPALVTAHSIQISGLTPGATYHYRVTSADAAANSATSPAPPAAPATVSVPAPPPTAFPGAVVVDAGSVRSGTFADLAAQDSAYFRVNATSPLLGTRTSSWYGRMTGVPTALTSLKVTYAGFNSRACTQVLQVYRWTTSSWVDIDSRSVSTTEVRIADLSPAGAAAGYVSAGGEVRVRVRCTSGSNFNTTGNLMQINWTT